MIRTFDKVFDDFNFFNNVYFRLIIGTDDQALNVHIDFEKSEYDVCKQNQCNTQIIL